MKKTRRATQNRVTNQCRRAKSVVRSISLLSEHELGAKAMNRMSAGSAAAALIGGTLLTASAAGALFSYQGDDFSYDWDSARRVMACDDESDGNDVHADFYVVGSGSLRQVHTDTGSGDCASSGFFSNGIYRHRIVEESWGEDPKGPWRYPNP